MVLRVRARDKGRSEGNEYNEDEKRSVLVKELTMLGSKSIHDGILFNLSFSIHREGSQKTIAHFAFGSAKENRNCFTPTEPERERERCPSTQRPLLLGQPNKPKPTKALKTFMTEMSSNAWNCKTSTWPSCRGFSRSTCRRRFQPLRHTEHWPTRRHLQQHSFLATKCNFRRACFLRSGSLCQPRR